MKKSSDNTNRPRKLEAIFRDGFEPAKVSPRASIWHHIEQELEVQQTSYYKKRVVWYRSVAAASITLLVLVISYFWYSAQTSRRLNLPEASSEVMVQNKSNKAIEEKVTANPRATPNQSVLAENLKKEQPNQPLVARTQQPRPINLSFNQKSRRSNLLPTAINPEQVVRTQQPAPDQSLILENEQAATEKTALDKIGNEQNKAFTPESGFALKPTQPVTSNNLPVDSSQVVIADDQSEFKKDSAAVAAAALMPAVAKKKTVGSRWALGGGTGSQYFEQNIKFANTATNSFATTPQAFTYSNISKNMGGSTIEAASKEYNENTRSAFSYRAAVAANYRINDKWSVEAGLNFAENKAQTTTTYIIYKRPGALNNIVNLNSGNLNYFDRSNTTATNVTIPVTIFLARLTDADPTNSQVTVEKVTPFNMYYRYRQLGVPVRLRYQYGWGKWFNFVQAGGALNVLVQTSILSDSPKVPNVEYPLGQSSPFRKWYVTALSSVGRGLKISEVWQVQGSLDVARSFSTVALSFDQIPNLSNQKPYYVGFGVSSSYVIGKK